ncbi:hypothetical protein ASPFODRAFT_188892 [Aspergillus luchuensis CBS 106.47]|uniref:Dienelactone hydrolase domain-containing protein n=1 Tax=Aspergillus luchuensis (strain CBS 106.47) TaxID=1137211 RepID=A0A1M3TJK8_ASPLC|nr:hypothetical protein ASPFODRAFT_188892 [Aspergillus luchuensis CBS 106.47]
MTSNAPSECCMAGHLHDGRASGEIQELANISTYIAYPPDRSTKNAILFLTDGNGHRFINAHLMADQFATRGFLVVMPDLFHGDPIPVDHGPDFDIMGWYNQHLPDKVDPIVNAILGEMRTTLGCQRVGAVGYCFGGKYVCRYLKAGKLNAGFIAHPTMVMVEELEGVEGPLSIAAASELSRTVYIPTLLMLTNGQVVDPVFTTTNRHESEGILARVGVPFQINLFSDVEHGFAVRCDPAEPRQIFAKEAAFEQAVAWFDRYAKE